MHAVAKKSLAVATAVGVAGISSLFFGAAPASASTLKCADGATLINGNVCEKTFTANGSFTSTKSMTHLQVLLVGGGGDGGYSGGGGGGAVKVIDFDGSKAGKFAVTVGGDVSASSVVYDKKTASAAGGTSSTNGNGSGIAIPGTSGASGNGNAGYPESGQYGGGGGAMGSPGNQHDGGAGLDADAAPVSTISGAAKTPSIPLFANDTACFGGGGAVGDGTTNGEPGCGAGSIQDGGALTAPTQNSGGGAGAIIATPTDDNVNDGAGGVVIFRWNAQAAVELKFSNGSHRHAPAAEHLLHGQTPTIPAAPVIKGYTFVAWYTSTSHKKLANFSTPVTKSETFYAKFIKTPKP